MLLASALLLGGSIVVSAQELDPVLATPVAVPRVVATRGDTPYSPLSPAAVAAAAPASGAFTFLDAPPEGEHHEHFQTWKAVRESAFFLGIQHAFRLSEDKTRRELDGPFFKDWGDSIENLQGWSDGGRQFTNYVAHPMEGAVYGFVFVQNDPKGVHERFGSSPGYWKSRLKAMAWSAAWSTQFEIGPISEASLGNVGLQPGKLGWGDIVTTPTLGAAWMVGEDILHRLVVDRVLRTNGNYLAKTVVSMGLNPMRSAANLLRFKVPWYRGL
jgi:hypothetical protein